MKKIRLYTKIKVYLENEFLKEIIIDNNCCTPEEFERGENFAKRVTTQLMKTIRGMHYKKKIIKRIYNFYLEGVCIEAIGFQVDMDIEEVNEIIDYLNEIYN
jgi:hypothetical protein